MKEHFKTSKLTYNKRNLSNRINTTNYGNQAFPILDHEKKILLLHKIYLLSKTKKNIVVISSPL